jgi:AraC-like DNA-binding protein
MCLFESGRHFPSGGIVNGVMFHIVCEGEGVIQCNNMKYKVSKNKMLVIWPNEFVRYKHDRKGSWWYKWVWLAGTKAQSILNKIGISPNNPFFDISNCANLLECLEETEAVFTSGEHSVFYPMQAAWNLIDALGRDFSSTLRPAVHDNIAELCRILIENKPGSFSCVNDLAEHFKVDRCTIFRTFKSAFNISPKEYIEKVRFEKACQLLSISEIKIKEISNICGYENQCYFSAAFQKRFGVSPSQWRQKQ